MNSNTPSIGKGTSSASATPTPVTQSDIEQFERVGAVPIRGLLNAEWIKQLEDTFSALKRDAVDTSTYYSTGDNKDPVAKSWKASTLIRDDNWMVNETMRRFIFESPIAQAAAALMRSTEVQLYEDLLIYKERAADAPTPWHQDEPQWPTQGTKICSVWLCLEPVTRETGALRFVTGTHRGPLYIPYVPPQRQSDLDRDMHYFDGGTLPDIDGNPWRYSVVSYDVQPGDVICFHTRTIHAAYGSAQTHPRRTFSVRFLGDDIRWRRKHCVFHDWLKTIDLDEGARLEHERFPVVWHS